MVFVSLLEKRRIIFGKHRTEEMKLQKEAALESLRLEYNEKTGRNLTLQQVKKKLHNIKFQIHLKEAGNRDRPGAKELKDWERQFQQLWYEESGETLGETRNISLSQVQDSGCIA